MATRWDAVLDGRRAEGSGDLAWHLPANDPMLRRAMGFLVAFALLQLLDMATTLLLLSVGGTEMNPVAIWSLRHGTAAFVAVKVGLAATLILFVPLLERERRPALAGTFWACFGLDVVFGGVVLSNLVQAVVFA